MVFYYAYEEMLMEAISNALQWAGNYLTSIGLSDFLDIIIVAYLIYKAIWFVRKTNFYNFAKGIIIILVSLWLSEIFSLTMIHYLLGRAVELGMIAVLILFQPELRRVLERMGSGLTANRVGPSTVMNEVISQTVRACSDMSDSRTGALVVFERNVSLNSAIGTGSVINADVNAELIKNIFFNKAPLHDGALIIRDGRIEAAGCVLPLTQRTNLSKDLGMRHRAGLGLSEQSDAIVVIVSEETGAISLAIDGKLKRHLSSDTLRELLAEELIREDSKKEKLGLFESVRRKITGLNNNEKYDEKNI